LESLYKYILGFFKSISNFAAIKYFPYIVLLFSFVLFSNLLGLVPYGFTITSQILTTFLLSISTFIGVTLIGFYNNKFNLVKFFIPSSVSQPALLGFLVIIEILSYIIRPFSLGIRLFANMLAGHTLIFILGNFAYSIVLKNIVLIMFIPFAVILLIMLLEFCIAFIQTYVFCILTIIYINDMFNVSH